jgi:hypothetical protein
VESQVLVVGCRLDDFTCMSHQAWKVYSRMLYFSVVLVTLFLLVFQVSPILLILKVYIIKCWVSNLVFSILFYQSWHMHLFLGVVRCNENKGIRWDKKYRTLKTNLTLNYSLSILQTILLRHNRLIVLSGIYTSIPLKLCSHLAFDMLGLFLQQLRLLKNVQNLASCKFFSS